MEQAWINKWNDRYRREAFAYGTSPNEFFQEQLTRLPPGKLLLPAEGEGRNAVYAASLGWEVTAFDISTEGQKKAMQLAASRQVTIQYEVGALPNLDFKPEQFDVIALIYAHFPASVKASYHQQLGTYLKKGGYILFEAFSKNHLKYIARNEQVGGPRDIESLFSVEEINADFPGYSILQLEEMEVTLSEGTSHNGVGSVIRFIGQK